MASRGQPAAEYPALPWYAPTGLYPATVLSISVDTNSVSRIHCAIMLTSEESPLGEGVYIELDKSPAQQRALTYVLTHAGWNGVYGYGAHFTSDIEVTIRTTPPKWYGSKIDPRYKAPIYTVIDIGYLGESQASADAAAKALIG